MPQNNQRKHPQFFHLTAAFAFFVMSAASVAHAEHTRVTNPNAVSVEFLGRGLLYSVDFDRVVNDDIVAGVGYGSTSMHFLDGSDAGVSTGLVPIYINYYLARDQGSFFGTVGADIVTNSSAVNGLKSAFGGVQFNSTPVLGTFGIGYENRSDAGFLFRVAAYGIYAQGINAWGGLTLGYSF